MIFFRTHKIIGKDCLAWTAPEAQRARIKNRAAATAPGERRNKDEADVSWRHT